MASSEDLRRIALSLEGTVEAPHFDRTAFKARRIYATLAADGRTTNLRFTPELQEFKCMMAPQAFAPVPNGWGRRGATTAILAHLTEAELEEALRTAWSLAAAPGPRQPRRRPAS
ncbi:MmcQ/YjbR family DNA-binding protein [Belnapia sp. F-4-1]|uniref:MmcQ/YjbR family DNA-binding protein n=1 Tax=Belnapia sp. F-4-1 TaxID=1545443 RepID=UPI0005BAAFF5|nr:MmcQ/YjbR family DNA-binding protein [Belnapia sp. F-4-1]